MKSDFINAKRLAVLSLAFLLAAATGVTVRLVQDHRDETILSPRVIESDAPPLLLQTSAERKLHGAFYVDKFATAPTHWRTAGAAVASVSQRWQCEPRWTFFTLENDRKIGKPAAMWHKQSFTGDVSVQFFFGNKMDVVRGNPFSYVRDVNLTIASDGNDLRNGYTFSFGGENNSCSYIMRNGVVVARVPVTIPKTIDYLRHWFAFRVERTGGKLAFSVDHFFSGSDGHGKELSYEDPNPLTGNRIAIWTYDNPMSIAKVTVSGETDGRSESPDFLPAPLATVYDAR